MFFQMTDAILSAKDINVHFKSKNGLFHAVRGVDLEIFPGETVAIVGESGAGKSAFARAIVHLNQPPFTPKYTYVTGKLTLNSPFQTDLINASPNILRKVRAEAIGMIFQDGLSALNPVLSIGVQLLEALHKSNRSVNDNPKDEIIEIINTMGFPEPNRIINAFPHQLSGGQCQRISIAIATLRFPVAIIADEPTTALDVTIQAQILKLLRDLCKKRSMSMIFISHDIGVVAEIADRIAVMKDGKVVEVSSKTKLFNSPSHQFTKKLLNSRPKPNFTLNDKARMNVGGSVAVSLEKVSYNYHGGVFTNRVGNIAVKNVDLTVFSGEMMGIVGESGSGKSTLAKLLLGFLKPSNGEIEVLGYNPTNIQAPDLLNFRKKVQVVYQDSISALNPRKTLGNSAAEGLEIHGMKRDLARIKVREIFENVGLPETIAERFPHQVSGGQRQRVCIARALALNPSILVADEPVTALDVTIQAQILELFRKLQRNFNLTIIFISHDLEAVANLCSRVAVMHEGAIIECNTTRKIFKNPDENFTKRLVDSIPGKNLML